MLLLFHSKAGLLVINLSQSVDLEEVFVVMNFTL